MSNNPVSCKSINQINDDSIKYYLAEMMAYWKNINKKLIFFRLNYLIILITEKFLY